MGAISTRVDADGRPWEAVYIADACRQSAELDPETGKPKWVPIVLPVWEPTPYRLIDDDGAIERARLNRLVVSGLATPKILADYWASVANKEAPWHYDVRPDVARSLGVSERELRVLIEQPEKWSGRRSEPWRKPEPGEGRGVERVSSRTKPYIDSPIAAIFALSKWFEYFGGEIPPSKIGRLTAQKQAVVQLLAIGLFLLDAAGYTPRALQIAAGRKPRTVRRLKQQGGEVIAMATTEARLARIERRLDESLRAIAETAALVRERFADYPDVAKTSGELIDLAAMRAARRKRAA
jgi:hypothetical protein